MTTIQPHFRHDKFDYEQIHRKGNVAVFRQSKGGKTYGFETVIIGHRRAGTLPDGTHFPEGEAYPRSEEWGTRGWSYRDESDAMAKAITLAA